MALECANCSECPLRSYWERKGHWNPIDFEENDGDILILGEAPSKQDVAVCRPFTDGSGIDIMKELAKHGRKRLSVDWGNLLGCRWPDDDPRPFLAQLQKRNRKRLKAGEPPLINPVRACWPHVQQKLDRYTTVLKLGS